MNKVNGGGGILAELFQLLKDDAVKVLHSICQQIWKTQQWPQEWKRSVFILSPKKGNAKGCSNCHIIALISHDSKGMLKILKVRLQQYVNCEFPHAQAGFRKDRRITGQIANICWNAREFLKKQESSRKTTISALLTMPKTLTVWITVKLWKILKEMGIPDHLTCLLRNIYASQEATVRTGHGTTDWFQTGKGVHQGCILSPCLFTLYAEYIICTLDARLDEAQAVIKIPGRNIYNLRCR